MADRPGEAASYFERSLKGQLPEPLAARAAYYLGNARHRQYELSVASGKPDRDLLSKALSQWLKVARESVGTEWGSKAHINYIESRMSDWNDADKLQKIDEFLQYYAKMPEKWRALALKSELLFDAASAGREGAAGSALAAALVATLACASAPKYRAGGRAERPPRGVELAPADSVETLPFALLPPVENWRCGRILSPYGYRGHRSGNGGRLHEGVDIDAEWGEEIRAAAEGVVRYSGRRSGYGTLVIIDHAGDVSTVYAHMSYLTVRSGQRVSAGDRIGRAGRRGRATGIHLHFELRRGGRPVDPSPHLCLDSASHSR